MPSILHVTQNDMGGNLQVDPVTDKITVKQATESITGAVKLYDRLDSNDPTGALSSNMGKFLNDKKADKTYVDIELAKKQDNLLYKASASPMYIQTGNANVLIDTGAKADSGVMFNARIYTSNIRSDDISDDFHIYGYSYNINDSISFTGAWGIMSKQNKDSVPRVFNYNGTTHIWVNLVAGGTVGLDIDFTYGIDSSKILHDPIIHNLAYPTSGVTKMVEVPISKVATSSDLDSITGCTYGGSLNDSTLKIVGYSYYDTGTKSLYRCVVSNSLNYPNLNYFEELSNTTFRRDIKDLFYRCFSSFGTEGINESNGITEVTKTKASGKFTIQNTGLYLVTANIFSDETSPSPNIRILLNNVQIAKMRGNKSPVNLQKVVGLNVGDTVEIASSGYTGTEYQYNIVRLH
ncbi:MAG: hypothetical protein ACRC7W_06655 [Fusobacteriaceae bacterium]